MLLRGSIRNDLERTLRSLLEKYNGARVNTAGMTDNQIKHRISEIKWWDDLSAWRCPLCGKERTIKLVSKIKNSLNLKCDACDARFQMTTCRALGAKIVT